MLLRFQIRWKSQKNSPFLQDEKLSDGSIVDIRDNMSMENMT